MKSEDMLTDASSPPSDRWYVTNGTHAVGPVNLDLLARGIEAGKIPLGSFVRHEGWKVWRPLVEVVGKLQPPRDPSPPAPPAVQFEPAASLEPAAPFDAKKRA